MNVEKQQEQVAEQEKEQTEQWNPDKDENNENNALFTILYGVRSPITRDYYLRRLRIFFNYIKLLPEETMEKRCDFFQFTRERIQIWYLTILLNSYNFKERGLKGRK